MSTVVFPEIGNYAFTLTDGAINASVTTINVDSAAALTLDNSTTDAYLTLVEPDSFGGNPFTNPETHETVLVTSISSNALTVTRGVDGTSGTAFSDNAYVMLRQNAATLQRVYDALTDGTDTLNFPGVTGGFTVGGDLTLGASGVNKMWESPLLQPGQEIIGTVANAPSALATKAYSGNRREVPAFTCLYNVSSRMAGVVSMPDDYDGSELEYDIYFTVANTNSGNVFWYVTASADDAGDSLTDTAVGSGTHAEAAPGTIDQLVTATGTFTPNSAANTPGQLVFFTVARLGSHASDTYGVSGDTVYFIGMKLKYAT
jgi:hypothetical protein